MSAPVEVFFSYSHRDDDLRDELAAHLAALSNQGIIRTWSDRRVDAGQSWRGEVDTHLDSAEIILLLVSSDFLASDYRYDVEMKRALERAKAGEAQVVPILLRACDFAGAPFAHLDMLPSGRWPVKSFPDRDEAWSDVARGIRALVQSITGKRAASTPAPPASPRVRGLQFFLSYRHGGEDEALARRIRDALTAEGASVFVAADMEVGTEWAREIHQRIESCDVFIPLLSRESIASEMVQREAWTAHRRRRREQKPRILPVRIRYEGPLGYDLDICLGRLQYALWRGPGDDVGLFDSLFGVASQAPSPLLRTPQPFSLRPAELAPTGRPAASFDPRILSAPGGTIAPNNPLYIERGHDARMREIAALTGQTLVIRGARQRGKSSLLARYVASGLGAGKRAALINFQDFSSADFESYLGFLTGLAAVIAEQLEVEGPEPIIKRQGHLSTFVQKRVLEPSPKPVVLAFDEVDRIGRPYLTDFSAMLRTWHNNRESPIAPEWSKLDLALVISTEPHLLITDARQSPFNVVPPIEIDGFTLDEHRTLNRRYPAPLSDAEVEDLFDLLRGHPYLTLLGHYRIAVERLSFESLLRNAADPHGPFGDHLRALLALLSQDPALLPALKQAIARGAVDDAGLADRLASAGLIRRRNDRYDPSNKLYSDFFKKAR